MKQLSKMMLAAVASVALAAPLYAWDFSASGSAAAYFNITTKKADKDANALTGGGVSSDGGTITLSSSNTDGANSAALSYAVNWADSGLDETISVSGSKKVGDWTGSGSVSYNLDRYGCSDNGSGTANVSRCGQQTAADSTSVSVTDGTMTITLGDASHLSSQNVTTGSTASGLATWDAADDDASPGAFVGAYEGVSLGYKIDDSMSVTVAYQVSSAVGDACGAGEAYDSEGANHGISGTGLGFSGTFGTISVGVTVCNAVTADKGTATTSAGSTSTTTSTTGLGVKMDMGDIDPFLSWGSYSGINSTSSAGAIYAGMELGLTYAMGSDTIIFAYGTTAEIEQKTDGTAGEATNRTGMEIGYNTTVGPVALSTGYGTQTADQTGGTEGYNMTDIEVAMSISF